MSQSTLPSEGLARSAFRIGVLLSNLKPGCSFLGINGMATIRLGFDTNAQRDNAREDLEEAGYECISVRCGEYPLLLVQLATEES